MILMVDTVLVQHCITIHKLMQVVEPREMRQAAETIETLY